MPKPKKKIRRIEGWVHMTTNKKYGDFFRIKEEAILVWKKEPKKATLIIED